MGPRAENIQFQAAGGRTRRKKKSYSPSSEANWGVSLVAAGVARTGVREAISAIPACTVGPGIPDLGPGKTNPPSTGPQRTRARRRPRSGFTRAFTNVTNLVLPSARMASQTTSLQPPTGRQVDGLPHSHDPTVCHRWRWKPKDGQMVPSTRQMELRDERTRLLFVHCGLS